MAYAVITEELTGVEVQSTVACQRDTFAERLGKRQVGGYLGVVAQGRASKPTSTSR